MKRFFLCWFFALPLFATVNKPLRGELGTGYRECRLHWHLQHDSALAQSEKYRDLQYWENDFTLKVIHRDISFLVQGGFGAFGRGDLRQKFADLSYATDQPIFQFSTDGWSAFGYSYFGYAVNLTPYRTYSVIFTPLLGYSGYFSHINRNHPSPNPFSSPNAVGGSSYTLSSDLSHDEKISWYGFLLGGSIFAAPGGRLEFEVGYTYHFLRTRLQAQTITNPIVFEGAAAVSSQIISDSITAKQGGCHGHSGWARLDVIISRFWRAGIGGSIHYFFSPVFGVGVKQTAQSLIPAAADSATKIDDKILIRWTSLAGLVNISREF